MLYHGVQCTFSPEYDATVLFEHLEHVLDPELDESILHLGFVRFLYVDNGHITVVVHLPTSWCAANFAYLRADDIRRALLSVAGIHQVTVRLHDHFAAEAIEMAVNAGKPFAETFPGEGCGSLAALRTTFLQKGFISRQERLLRALRAGCSPEDMCTLRIGDVTVQEDVCVVRTRHAAVTVSPAEMLSRYLTRRAALDLDCTPTAPLFTDLHGQPLTSEQLEAYYTAARTVRVALEGNGMFCRALLARRQPAAPASIL